MANIPITNGQGQSSVATEQVGNFHFQRIEVMGQGGASVLAINPDGSINASIIGSPGITVTGSVVSLNTGSIISVSQGSVITVWQNSSVLAVPVGSVITVLQSSSIIAIATGSVATIPTGNQSVSGAINVSGSVLLGSSNASIISYLQNSSIIAINAGSVVALSQGSVITVLQSSSILAIPVGSVITVWTTPSIVGTYAEDTAFTNADKGLLAMGVRNDAVASFAGSNLEYTPHGLDSAGRFVTKPFSPEESRIEGYNSVVSTSVTTLVGAAGAGLKNYITDIQVANTGATTTLVTFRSGGGTSVLGYTIAPTGGGSNITLQTPMRTLANETFDFQPTSASSILFVTVKGFKAP